MSTELFQSIKEYEKKPRTANLEKLFAILNKSDTDLTLKKDNLTPLELAASRGCEDVVRLLLYKGAYNDDVLAKTITNLEENSQSGSTTLNPSIRKLLSDPLNFNNFTSRQRAFEFAENFLEAFRWKLNTYRNESHEFGTKVEGGYQGAHDAAGVIGGTAAVATVISGGTLAGGIVGTSVTASIQFLSKKLGGDKHRQKAKKAWQVFRTMSTDDVKGLDILIWEAALEIFQIFDQYFVEMRETKWTQEGSELAKEAVERIMSYVITNSPNVTLEEDSNLVLWCLKGKSKFSKPNKTNLEYIIEEGGVVKIDKTTGNKEFWRRKTRNGKHAVNKAGYRVLPDWECESISDEKYEKSDSSDIRQFYTFPFTTDQSIREKVVLKSDSNDVDTNDGVSNAMLLEAGENQSLLVMQLIIEGFSTLNQQQQVTTTNNWQSGSSGSTQSTQQANEEVFDGENRVDPADNGINTDNRDGCQQPQVKQNYLDDDKLLAFFKNKTRIDADSHVIKPTIPMDVSSDFYRLPKGSKGHALIIINTDFSNFFTHGLLQQNEGEAEVNYVSKLWTELGYTPNVASKFTREELFTTIKSFIAKLSDKDASVVVYVWSHADFNKMFTTDLEQVCIFQDIFFKFDAHNCPLLQEKPKIFITQSCNSCTDVESQVRNFSLDAGGQLTNAIILFACPKEGHEFKNNYFPAYFPYCLTKVFMEHAHRSDLHTMIETVCMLLKIVAPDSDTSNSGQLCTPIDYGMKTLYFNMEAE